MLSWHKHHKLHEEVVAVDSQASNTECRYTNESAMVLESCPFVFLQNSRSELVKETKNNIIARQVNLVSIVVPVIPGIVDPVNPRGTEILKGIRTQDDAKKIAAEEIKEEMVPPALPEVWKPMSESDL